MANFLKSSTGILLKASNGNLLTKYEKEFITQYPSLSESGGSINMFARNGKEIIIDQCDVGIEIWVDTDNGLVIASKTPSGYVHCWMNYVAEEFYTNEAGYSIYLYDFDMYNEENWMDAGCMGDSAVEGQWIVNNLTPFATIWKDPIDNTWHIT